MCNGNIYKFVYFLMLPEKNIVFKKPIVGIQKFEGNCFVASRECKLKLRLFHVKEFCITYTHDCLIKKDLTATYSSLLFSTFCTQ